MVSGGYGHPIGSFTFTFTLRKRLVPCCRASFRLANEINSNTKVISLGNREAIALLYECERRPEGPPVPRLRFQALAKDPGNNQLLLQLVPRKKLVGTPQAPQCGKFKCSCLVQLQRFASNRNRKKEIPMD